MTLPELRGILVLFVALAAGLVIVFLYAVLFIGLIFFLPLLA